MFNARLAPVALAALVTSPAAQFNERWASFVEDPTALPSGAAVSDDLHETDLDWDDLDLDGDIDLVVVRKNPFTPAGKRSNVLLVNESGVLTDRTSTLAVASDLGGDSGFLTPTNDRDVVLADLTGDGYPEVVTAVDQGQGEPKPLSHPRVYLNLGVSGPTWLGLRYEDARIPQLLHATSGVPVSPRFVAVDAGDLDNDGFLDLYFGDNDTGPTLFGQLESPADDSNDRLLVNDGTGFFTDGSAAAMTPAMLDSGFCNSVAIGDFNLDGTRDVLKQATYGGNSVRLAYNDPNAVGTFGFQQNVHTESPYFVNAGDLNNDGRLDIVFTQNAIDRFKLNTGNDGLGLVAWGPSVPFEYLTGGEVGFSYAGNNLITDIDGDGWGDILIADVDPELPLYEPGWRLRIFRNQAGPEGDAFGSLDFAMREERASTSDDHWIGVDGMNDLDLRWTHDVAVFDVDGDGKNDMVVSRREGTQVWKQVDAPFCQESLEYGDGLPILEMCGGDLSSGTSADLRLFGAEPNAPVFLIVGAADDPFFVASYGITIAPNPLIFLLALTTDGSGELELSVPGGGGPYTVYGQAATADALLTVFDTSNALKVDVLP